MMQPDNFWDFGSSIGIGRVDLPLPPPFVQEQWPALGDEHNGHDACVRGAGCVSVAPRYSTLAAAALARLWRRAGRRSRECPRSGLLFIEKGGTRSGST